MSTTSDVLRVGDVVTIRDWRTGLAYHSPSRIRAIRVERCGKWTDCESLDIRGRAMIGGERIDLLAREVSVQTETRGFAFPRSEWAHWVMAVST